MKDNLAKLQSLTENWLAAKRVLIGIEGQMQEFYGPLMDGAKSIEDFMAIIDVLPKECFITRRVYEALIEFEDNNLDNQ